MVQANNEGRCRGCGFLAKRPHQSWAWPVPIGEVTLHERNLGALDPFNATGAGGGIQQHASAPICLKSVFQFQTTVAAQLPANVAATNAREFAEARACHSWFSWHPGLSPERHLDLEVNALAEESRQIFEKGMQNTANRFSRMSLWIAVFAVLAGIGGNLIPAAIDDDAITLKNREGTPIVISVPPSQPAVVPATATRTP